MIRKTIHTTEASTLGLRPGHWPETLVFTDGLLYVKHQVKRGDDGDVIAVDYVNDGAAARLTVWND